MLNVSRMAMLFALSRGYTPDLTEPNYKTGADGRPKRSWEVKGPPYGDVQSTQVYVATDRDCTKRRIKGMIQPSHWKPKGE
jgi:hypothetical protein